MSFITVLVGLLAATVVWFVGSHFIARLIVAREQNNPAAMGTKRSQVEEVLICGGLFLICLALAFAIASVMSS
ncbi:MAG TPA: hypothetical protein VJX67_14720 [Blastocatellia bacterium]|nr:hypothetical protein [Blastocatellia bacterium]